MDTVRSPAPPRPDTGEQQAPRTTVTLGSRAAARVFGVGIAVLVAAHVVGALLRELAGAESFGGLVPAFDMGAERSVPTWFTSMVLLLTAAAAGALAVALHGRDAAGWRNWAFIAAVLLVLSVEEVADLHGYWADRLHEQYDTSGMLRYAWVVPAAVLAAAVAASQLRFVLSLERPLRRALVTAAAVYVGAAIGIELIQGALEPTGLGAALLLAVEEAAEVAAIALACVAVLRHIERRFGRPTLTLTRA